jgi:hypothetical protein
VLTAVDQDLRNSVKRVTLGFAAPASGAGAISPAVLAYVEIVSAQDDVARYWFFDQQYNGVLPAGIFEPGAANP